MFEGTIDCWFKQPLAPSKEYEINAVTMAEGRKQAEIVRCLNELTVPNLNIINQKNYFWDIINAYFCNCDMNSHYSSYLGDESWWWA